MSTTSQPAPQAENTPSLIERRVSGFLPMLKELGPTFYLTAIGALYVSGFLVLNANLAKSGVLDIEFVDARYFLAGANFVFYLVCFYLFAGRAALFMPKWLREDLERANRDRPKPMWSFVVFAHSQVSAIFLGCLSAALFTSVAINSSESAIFYAILTGAFLFLYTLDVTNLDQRFPRFSETCAIAVKLLATYTFFAYVGTGAMLTVFISYVGIFAFINLVLDSFTRYKITEDRITFTGIYAVVFLLVIAIAYGALFYGQVSSKLGGARPQTVSVGFSEEVRKALPPPFSASASQVLEGTLIYQTSSYTYLSTSGHTLRLRAADVVVLVLTPEPEKDFRKEFLQRIITAPKLPKSAP